MRGGEQRHHALSGALLAALDRVVGERLALLSALQHSLLPKPAQDGYHRRIDHWRLRRKLFEHLSGCHPGIDLPQHRQGLGLELAHSTTCCAAHPTLRRRLTNAERTGRSAQLSPRAGWIGEMGLKYDTVYHVAVAQHRVGDHESHPMSRSKIGRAHV